MRVPSWVIVAAAVAMALPFGWGLGVLAADLVAGKEFGQLPAATVPLGILAALVFALWPSIAPGTRLKVLSIGTFIVVLLGRLIG